MRRAATDPKSQSGLPRMNALIFETRRISFATRFVVLAAAALALAACETDGTGPTAAGAPKAEVASAKPDAATPEFAQS